MSPASSRRRTALLLAALSAAGCAGPEPQPAQIAAAVECPPGSRKVEQRCVATDVSCPEGASWDGSKCVCGKCVGEPDAPAGAQALVGEYVGEIGINGKNTVVQTRLSILGGTITGDYAYGVGPTQGRFSECQIAARHLSCRWTEATLSGAFRVKFDEDGRAFAGEWDFSDGRPGGSWNGRRSPGVAAQNPPGQVPSAPGGIGGVYRGSIGIGNSPQPVTTELHDSGGQITGVYQYGGSPGQLSSCQLAGRHLSCTWIEGSLVGGFQVDFAADLRSFSGSWDFAGGKPGGAWTGTR